MIGINWYATKNGLTGAKALSQVLAQQADVHWLEEDDAGNSSLTATVTVAVTEIRFPHSDKSGTKKLLQLLQATQLSATKPADARLLIIGFCPRITIDDVVASADIMPILDGIITPNNVTAEWINLQFLLPTLTVRMPYAPEELAQSRAIHSQTTVSKPSQVAFARKFMKFIEAVRLSRANQHLCSVVARELNYLGVESDSCVVDTVAKSLSSI